MTSGVLIRRCSRSKEMWKVKGSASGGFYSAIDFTCRSDRSLGLISTFMVPGAIYGDPTYDGDRSPGGTLNYGARHLLMREDILAAPLFAMSFKDGASIAMLDPAPRGNTTEEESKLTNLVMTDARFQFGAMGAWQAEDGAVQFGFRYPGTVNDFGGARGQPAVPRWIRRYHPITEGFADNYRVAFRFGQDESFRDLTRDAWRWAWNTLNPPVNYIDVDQVRRVLLDHLEAQAVTIDGRTGIPFARSIVVDTPNWNWTMIAMGFVGKNLECANQLLLEGDRDKSERGQKMRATGLAIIASMIQAFMLFRYKPRDTISRQAGLGITSGWLPGCGMPLRICVYSCRPTAANSPWDARTPNGLLGSSLTRIG